MSSTTKPGLNGEAKTTRKQHPRTWQKVNLSLPNARLLGDARILVNRSLLPLLALLPARRSFPLVRLRNGLPTKPSPPPFTIPTPWSLICLTRLTLLLALLRLDHLHAIQQKTTLATARLRPLPLPYRNKAKLKYTISG